MHIYIKENYKKRKIQKVTRDSHGSCSKKDPIEQNWRKLRLIWTQNQN